MGSDGNPTGISRRDFFPWSIYLLCGFSQAIGCGFVIAGGTSNTGGKITDISYYSLDEDLWSKVCLVSLRNLIAVKRRCKYALHNFPTLLIQPSSSVIF
jgi:hypothetical protein